ncbi:MAG: bifunctional phosphoribosylaminoimidazolecarboxamide formyltransferase/IMP cyclohydrolase [Alphaproteobacteria bacterium]
MTTNQPIARALLSVADKTGIVDFAKELAGFGVELVSTGGTASTLAAAGLAITQVADVTGFPEMLDGRVKTLHPKIHAGLLAVRTNAGHAGQMGEHAIIGIDLLVSNLYPFEATLESGAGFDACIENIDIGGPAMTRSGAKNHAFVTVITDPGDYDAVLEEMAANDGATTDALRARLAAIAFARTAAYDSAISTWLAGVVGQAVPRQRSLAGTLIEPLRYGENPHQGAAFYGVRPSLPGLATATQIQGKSLSYNNINDTAAALDLVVDLDPERASVAIIKHANPCGVAVGDTLALAHGAALKCDNASAFGGIVALNQPLDAEVARAISEIFTEVVIAPGASPEARAILAVRKNLRVLLVDPWPDPQTPSQAVHSVTGGFLVQDRDTRQVVENDLQVVSARAPSPAEISDLIFAFRIAKHVKSNAIVYARNGATVGIGAGQMSRVDSVRIAASKADRAAQEAGAQESATIGSVVASDAFFPFADGLIAAADAGATAIIQPGGSKRDSEVIAAADEAGLAMVFTGVRHFRH